MKEEKKRRTFGQHFTSTQIFEEYIFPKISNILYQFIWVDLFAGEGNLILPILKHIPEAERISFFKEHIFLFDIQQSCIEKSIKNASQYGIPREIAQKNIQQRDSLRDFPTFLKEKKKPLFHITNPPYLYLGYIVKTKEANQHLELFQGINEGYQDLYQLALMNDLYNQIGNMIYIIPSNFLFGNSISNKFRDDFLKEYKIESAFIFEKKIFEYTGTNVIICRFIRKSEPQVELQTFIGEKIGTVNHRKRYDLDPKYHYKAGCGFEAFVAEYENIHPLMSSYYLMESEIKKNVGNNELEVIDANGFTGGTYRKFKIQVNNTLKNRILSNPLWIRTVDTGSMEGRVGLYSIKESFHVDGIIVTKATYRTHPIQLFIDPPLSFEDLQILKDYFNLIVELLRKETDSEFMTTYKYSGAEYTRKYFGLSQAKKIINTFPSQVLNSPQKVEFKAIIHSQNEKELKNFLKKNKENTI